MQYKTLFIALVFTPVVCLAATSPDGYYNVTNTTIIAEAAVLHNELEGQQYVGLAYRDTSALQFYYDSTNQSAGFNNSSSTSNHWEYEHMSTPMFWYDSAYINAAFIAEKTVDLYNYSPTSTESWIYNTNTSQLANLLLLTGSDTTIENNITEQENFVNTPQLFTADSDLSLDAGLETEKVSYEVDSASLGTQAAVNIDSNVMGLQLTLGLKQGTDLLQLANILGRYQFSESIFYDYCQDDSPGYCLKQVQQSKLNHFEVDFDGNGNCTINNFTGTNTAVQRTIDTAGTPLLYIDTFDNTNNITCNYSVSSVDQLQINWAEQISNTDMVVGRTLNLIVSASHRYLSGNDQFSTTPLVNRSFDRGTLFAMKKTDGLAEYDFSGTYLGSYQGIIYDNTDDSASDISYFKQINHQYTLTFDGLGGCAYEEYQKTASLHYYPATKTHDVMPSKSESKATCDSYFIMTQSSGDQYVEVVIIPDQFVLQGYLSDNGETIVFTEASGKNSAGGDLLVSNDGSNGILGSNFSYRASIIKLMNGFAIKYAGTEQGLTETIDAWLLPYEEQQQEKFIEQFYQTILGRTADEAGMTHWKQVLQTSSATEVAKGFLNSPELMNKGLSNGDYVNILYQSMFNRQADSGGFDNWMTQLNAGELRSMVNYGFFRSQEFKNLADSFGVVAFSADDHKVYQVAEFVKRFYTLVLNRQPDSGGFNDWSSQLNGGTRSGGDIALGFFMSAEFTNRQTDDNSFVDICYQAFFGRAADAEGKVNWLNSLGTGSSRLDIVNGFIGSLEFSNLASQYGIQAQ